jgi:hypothetical protein
MIRHSNRAVPLRPGHCPAPVKGQARTVAASHSKPSHDRNRASLRFWGGEHQRPNQMPTPPYQRSAHP